MNILFSLVTFMFAGISASAADCIEMVNRSNWPGDKYELLLSCKRIETSVGESHFDGLCFAIKKTQSSNYRSTQFQTVRYSDMSGSLTTIVSADEDGSVSEDGNILQDGHRLKVSEKKYSFEFNQKWVETTSVDLSDTSKLLFTTHNKKFLRTTLSESSLYSCQKMIP